MRLALKFAQLRVPSLVRFCQAMQLDPSSEYSRRVFDCVDAVGWLVACLWVSTEMARVPFRMAMVRLTFARSRLVCPLPANIESKKSCNWPLLCMTRYM